MYLVQSQGNAPPFSEFKEGYHIMSQEHCVNDSIPDNGASAQDRHAADVLVQVSRMVGGNLELEAVLDAALDAAAEAMNAEACSLLLRGEDAGADELRFHIAKGRHAVPLQNVRLPVDERSIAGWVAKHREALLIPEAYKDARFDSRYDAATGFRTHSVLCAPLCAKNKQHGVIQILNRRDGRPFDQRDLELLEAVAALIAVAIDNAEQHQALLKSQRLATIGQTMAGMAHCIKNILNCLQAGTYIIDQNVDADQNSPVVRGWRIVKRNMQLLGSIVMDMLSYSKQRKPLYQSCSLADVCQDVLSLVEQRAAEKSVTLVNRPSTELGEVLIDEAGIKRCLLNLVGNAVDACEAHKGVVELETTPADAIGHFTIRIRDSGCGMEGSALERIFDPFYSTKGGKGTGLGLAVTRKIIEEHGGTIQVKSSPGAGTEFTITLRTQPRAKGSGQGHAFHLRHVGSNEQHKERSETTDETGTGG